MATPNIITPDILAHITKNCTKTAAELQKDIKEFYGVDVSVPAVWGHMKKARDSAADATALADEHISKQIAERVEENVVPLMNIMEREILKLSDALEGKGRLIRVKPEKDKETGLETGFLQNRDYIAISKELRENIKSYVSLRPQVQTVKVEDITDRTRDFVFGLDEEGMDALEIVKKKYEEIMNQKSEEVEQK